MAEEEVLQPIRAAYPNGDFFDGMYNKAGARHGRGLYTWKNGNRYDGMWKNGAKHGKGTYTFASGNFYEGFGKFVFAKSGNKYEGQWVANKKHGTGKQYFAVRKEWFVGSWADDDFSGPGSLYHATDAGDLGAKICDGEWCAGDDGQTVFVQKN